MITSKAGAQRVRGTGVVWWTCLAEDGLIWDVMSHAEAVSVVSVNDDVVPSDDGLPATFGENALLKARELVLREWRKERVEHSINLELSSVVLSSVIDVTHVELPVCSIRERCCDYAEAVTPTHSVRALEILNDLLKVCLHIVMNFV